jgi:uncharacterized protein (TIGR01777 family)
MKIGITGVTGLIGRRVAALARERGHEVIGFTRNPERRGPEWRRFSTEEMPDVTGCDAILNLVGESVIGLWSRGKRRAIRDSRVQATRRIVEAIRAVSGVGKKPPRVLVNASGIGIYGEMGDQVTDEGARRGNGFLAEVCEAWEGEALRARETGTRVALLRTGMVLGREGGALAAMLPVFRLGLGGKLGNGRQWVSWIHIEDEAALALAALEDETIDGPVNGTAPNPVRNVDFTRALAGRLGRPAFFAVPGFALRAAAGGFAAELLESRRIVPAAAAKAGFAFRFPEIEGALDDLLKKG